jgi:hypothetical protein
MDLEGGGWSVTVVQYKVYIPSQWVTESPFFFNFTCVSTLGLQLVERKTKTIRHVGGWKVKKKNSITIWGVQGGGWELKGDEFTGYLRYGFFLKKLVIHVLLYTFEHNNLNFPNIQIIFNFPNTWKGPVTPCRETLLE